MRIDVVGCGAVTALYHAPVLRALSRSGEVTVRACFDIDLARARRIARQCGARIAAVPDDVTPTADVDAALIAAPPDMHAALATQYLQHGKAVLLEKPLATRAADAGAIVALAAEHGSRLLVGHIRRLYPAVQAARYFVAAGGLGEIHLIEASEGSRWDWPTQSDYVVTTAAGSVLMDSGSHLLDMTLFVLSLDAVEAGATVVVDNVQRSPETEPSHDFRADLHITSARKRAVRVRLGVSRIEPLAGAVKIHGDRGTLIVPTTFALRPVLIVGGQNVFLAPPHWNVLPIDFNGCLILEHREFISCVKNPSAPSLLDGERFVGLVSFLETLAGDGSL